MKICEYDETGKLKKETEPNGNLTPDNPDDFATTYGYNEIDQLVWVKNSISDTDKITYEYDNVGNQTRVTLPKGLDTPGDLNDYAVRKEYDLNHRVVKEIDAKGNYTHYQYNADGQVTRFQDKEGNYTYKDYDLRGLLIQERVTQDTGKE